MFSACSRVFKSIKVLFDYLLLSCSRMSDDPEPTPSVPPGQRSAAWKMGDSEPQRPVQKRAKRPRIDIDAQIAEANRLAALLKKVQQSARAIKKSGQRTKKRLLAKAGRLSGDDLERIAVIKRCGLIVDPRAGTNPASSSEDRPSMQASKVSTRGTITDQLVRLFDGILPTDRPVVQVAPPASQIQSELAVPIIQSEKDACFVLRLPSSARVGSALTGQKKTFTDDDSLATGQLNMDHVDGNDVDRESDEEPDEHADE